MRKIASALASAALLGAMAAPPAQAAPTSGAYIYHRAPDYGRDATMWIKCRYGHGFHGLGEGHGSNEICRYGVSEIYVLAGIDWVCRYYYYRPGPDLRVDRRTFQRTGLLYVTRETNTGVGCVIASEGRSV